MKRTVRFFPDNGERNSPLDYIRSVPKADGHLIGYRLALLAETELADWPPGWVKHFEGKVYELKTKPSRVMFFLDGEYLVVIHAFKKPANKTRPADVNRMRLHFQAYLQQASKP